MHWAGARARENASTDSRHSGEVNKHRVKRGIEKSVSSRLEAEQIRQRCVARADHCCRSHRASGFACIVQPVSFISCIVQATSTNSNSNSNIRSICKLPYCARSVCLLPAPHCLPALPAHLQRSVVGSCRDLLHAIKHIHAVNNLTENCVLPCMAKARDSKVGARQAHHVQHVGLHCTALLQAGSG